MGETTLDLEAVHRFAFLPAIIFRLSSLAFLATIESGKGIRHMN